MTTEKAIRILQIFQKPEPWELHITQDAYDALQMAIDALEEQERKEKTMKERSFDEMIAYFNRRVSEMDIAQNYKIELLGMVTALGYKHKKTAQQWIPCKVRLPEELEEVNVTWINHDPESYYDFVKGKPFTGSAVYYKEKWYWYSSTCTDILGEYGENDIDEVGDAIEIIAWKPIGEPWKGEQK